jgi:hypothetical protein
MDGTGRVSLRNRVFLKAIIPFSAEIRKDHDEVVRPDVVLDRPCQSLASGGVPAMVWHQDLAMEVGPSPVVQQHGLCQEDSGGLGEDPRQEEVPQEDVEEVPRRSLEEEQDQDPWTVVVPRKGSRTRKPVDKYDPASWGRLGALEQGLWKDHRDGYEGMGEDPRQEEVLPQEEVKGVSMRSLEA